MEINILISERDLINIESDEELGKFVRKKYHEKLKILRQNQLKTLTFEKIDLFDKCVLCGKYTNYYRTTHILDRLGYVEGVGQGCPHPFKCKK